MYHAIKSLAIAVHSLDWQLVLQDRTCWGKQLDWRSKRHLTRRALVTPALGWPAGRLLLPRPLRRLQRAPG